MGLGFISYKVKNDQLFVDAIKRAKEVTDDLRIPFSGILKDFYRSEQAIFKLSGPGQYQDFKSGGPNSPYAKAKAKKWGHKYPLLLASGRLAGSLLSDAGEGAIADVQRLSLTIGTSVSYGRFHQSDDSRTKIPLRKFLFIGPEAPEFATSDQMGRAERWLNIMNDYVLAKLRISGAFQK